MGGLHGREVLRIDREYFGRRTTDGLPPFGDLDRESPDQGGDRITPAIGRPTAIPVIIREGADDLGLVDASLLASFPDGLDGALVGGRLESLQRRQRLEPFRIIEIGGGAVL